jgi:hypothetical protein
MIKFKDLPIEIQNKMLEHQEAQGNKRDECVFIKDIKSSLILGGFDWCDTIEGDDFWRKFIAQDTYKPFFEKYPTKNIPELKGILMEVSNSEDFAKSYKMEVIGIFEGLYVCMPIDRSYIVRYRYARLIKKPKEITIEEAQKIIGNEFKIIK